jgi:hypothetical protein
VFKARHIERSLAEVTVVAVAARGRAGFEFVERAVVVERGAEDDRAFLQIRVKRALIAVELALAFSAGLDPAEPIKFAAIGGASQITERFAIVVVPDI